MIMALLDTTFLIDVMKEAKKRRAGPATVKLDELIRRGEALRIAVFTIGELYVGVAKGTQPTREQEKVERALQPFEQRSAPTRRGPTVPRSSKTWCSAAPLSSCSPMRTLCGSYRQLARIRRCERPCSSRSPGT
jgi:hypothetical protein